VREGVWEARRERGERRGEESGRRLVMYVF
jgi:hypothetical protein